MGSEMCIRDRRLTDRKNRTAADDEFVLKERDYSEDGGIMIGVW